MAAVARQAKGTGKLAGLRPCEEAAAAVHFRALAKLNRNVMPFAFRRMHPMPDSFNALPSPGYMLAPGAMIALAGARGLDSHAGKLHATGAGGRRWSTGVRCESAVASTAEASMPERS